MTKKPRKKKTAQKRISSFDFPPGRVLARKYEVISKLGSGWEGEVYMLRELATGIERAAKFFFPHRNQKDKAIQFNAQKLHKLRHCPILIQYRTQEAILFRGAQVSFLVSDFVEGERLSDFLSRQKGKRLHYYEALHLLHALAVGMEAVHALGEYHGDLHPGNVLLRRKGLKFDLNLIDLFHWGKAKPENLQDDVYDMIRIVYDALGGAKHYKGQPEVIKQVCRGMKWNLITKKYRTAAQLRTYLENMPW